MNTETVTDWTIYPNFKEREFACRCGYGTNRICKELLDMLQRARKIASIPFVITSGCRCPAHNSTVSTSQTSDHIADENNICFGVDIACSEDRNRYFIISALKYAGFNRIGIARGIIHAGIGRQHDGRNDDYVIWIY